jgi:primase-polymerase (primpol)-like protein
VTSEGAQHAAIFGKHSSEGRTTKTRPLPLAPNFDAFPPILTGQSHWVLWRYSLKDGKWTKVPKKPDGRNASTANAATWCTFNVARTAYARGGFDGVGIVLTGEPLANGLYLIGMDFDHCLNAGALDDDPREAIDSLDTYAEISPSGEGVRLFLLHDKLIPAKKINISDKSREIYSGGRYLTVTGHTLGRPRTVRHVA